MNVELVWITPDAQQVVGHCARVSNPANQDNPEIKGLLGYCICKGHWSIFEMASMCISITTTRSISAQLLRHSSFSFQEFSQRYAQVQETDMPELRRADPRNRQNSIDDLPSDLTVDYYNRILDHFDDGFCLYEDMLADGIAKECARAVLPMNVRTKLYMSGNLRSWLHYIDLRCGNGTQLEHQQIAEGIKEIFTQECPTIAHAMWPDCLN